MYSKIAEFMDVYNQIHPEPVKTKLQRLLQTLRHRRYKL